MVFAIQGFIHEHFNKPNCNIFYYLKSLQFPNIL